MGWEQLAGQTVDGKCREYTLLYVRAENSRGREPDAFRRDDRHGEQISTTGRGREIEVGKSGIRLTADRETVGTGTRCLTSGRLTVGADINNGKGSGDLGRERNSTRRIPVHPVPFPSRPHFADPTFTAPYHSFFGISGFRFTRIHFRKSQIGSLLRATQSSVCVTFRRHNHQHFFKSDSFTISRICRRE